MDCLPLQSSVSHLIRAAHDQGTGMIVVENAKRQSRDVCDRAHLTFPGTVMDPAPPDLSPKASGSKPLPQSMRGSSSARPSHLVHDSIQSQPTIPEDESKDAPEPPGLRQTKSSLWHRPGLDVTFGSAELDILLVSTCLKLLLFPA